MPLAAMPETEYLRVAFAVATEPMLVVDGRTGDVIDANPAFAELRGLTAAELVGRSVETLLTGIPPRDGAGVVDWRGANGNAESRRAHRYSCGARPDGDWLLVLAPPTIPPGKIIEPDSLPLDSLTGLPTRDAFDRHLAECLQRARGAGSPSCAVLFLDLDDFKPVNDRLGHAMGDRVLQAVARRLAGGIRPGDLLARRGGDEFTLLVAGIHSPDEALHIAERLMRISQEPVMVDGQQLPVGVSIGIAMVDGSAADPADIIAMADRAMYEAKRTRTPVIHQGGDR